MPDMWWTIVTDPEETKGYGRWESKGARHYAIQRFVYRDSTGTHQTDPYYCLYDLWKMSRKIGEFTTLQEAKDHVDL